MENVHPLLLSVAFSLTTFLLLPDFSPSISLSVYHQTTPELRRLNAVRFGQSASSRAADATSAS